MQHLKVSGAVRPLKWSLGVKWLRENVILSTCVGMICCANQYHFSLNLIC